MTRPAPREGPPSDGGPAARGRDLAAAYRDGLRSIDAAFEAARAELGASLPCRKGCGHCCAAVFDVWPADAVLLGAWLDEQAPRTRAAVLARARSVVAAVEDAAARLAAAGEPALADWASGEGLQALPSAAVTRLAGAVSQPCPLLDEGGACRAHASRPALCRLQGLPWRDPATGAGLPDLCRLEPSQEALAPRALDLAALDGLRHEVGETVRSLGLAVPRRRTFVAAALLNWAPTGPNRP